MTKVSRKTAGAPLAGRTVMVTRSQAQAAGLADPLKAAGANVVTFPVVEQVDPQDWGLTDEAIAQLDSYDWIILTSPNAVARFAARLAHQGVDARAGLESASVAVVGSGTAAALGAFGVEPALVPHDFRGEGLAEAFERLGSLEGVRILIPRAEVAREVLPEALRAQGAHVDVAPVYRTIRAHPDPLGKKALRDGGIDVITFTSPSTVKHFVSVVRDSGMHAEDVFEDVASASIGPVTSEAIRRRGFEPTIEADESSIPGLIDAIERWAAGARG